MNIYFEKIPQDKKNKIIDASLKEFAQKGYEKASTNNIVKEAGIPKGTLFYFFGSKKKLYFYILDYTINKFLERYKEEKKELSSDIFERLEQRGLLKLKIAMEEHLLYEIIFKSIINVPDHLKCETYEKYSQFRSGSELSIYEGIDNSKFKKGTDIKKVVEVITMFLEGYLNRHMDTFKKSTALESIKLYKKISNEVKEYLKIIKEGVYK